MAAVEIVLDGVLVDKTARTMRPVIIFGSASLAGVGVGGGPVIPPDAGGGDPPHIWGGGNVPMPNPPIANVPGAPGYRPPHIWGGGNEPFPTPPIVIPGPPVDPPTEPPVDSGDVVKAPPPGGGWGFTVPYGWAFFPMAGKPGPK